MRTFRGDKFVFSLLPKYIKFNLLNAELNPICHLLALLGAHHIFHVSGLRVKLYVNIILPFQINHQPDATIFQFIILTFIYSSTYFGHFPAHHQKLNDCSGSLWFYLCIVVTVVQCSWSGRPAGRPARPLQSLSSW
jgi:hypothetical protein